MKKFLIGFLVVSAWLALCMAGGESIIQMHIAAEMVLRTFLICFFGVAHLIIHRLVTQK